MAYVSDDELAGWKFLCMQQDPRSILAAHKSFSKLIDEYKELKEWYGDELESHLRWKYCPFCGKELHDGYCEDAIAMAKA